MDSFVITENASTKIKKLIDEEGNQHLKLRIYIEGGGCAGMQYGFEFAESLNDDDFVFEKGEISVVIDNISFQYLQGASIDFVETLAGANFTIKNPNAQTSCGCGSSFVV
jgi:iron-sulfur cluster insertion protein